VSLAPAMPRQKRGRSKQDYGTPWPLIHAVEARFGPLAVDLAARADNAKAPRFITPEEDSLRVVWSERFPGAFGWLNPEFDPIAPWAAKCAAETAKPGRLRVALLTPASVGSNWYAEHVHGRAAVLALSPRIVFEGETLPYPKDCILSVFGLGVAGFDVWRWQP